MLGHPGLPTLVAFGPSYASARILAPLRPLSRQLRLVLVDLLGPPELSALLDSSLLPRRFVLLGVSDTCGLAVELALAAPSRVSGVLLASPLPSRSRARALSQALRAHGMRGAVARWLCGGSLSARSRRALLAESRATWAAPPLRRARLAALEVPWRMIVGACDPLAPSGLARGPALDRVEYAGHLPFLSRAVAFNGRVSAFLAETGEGHPLFSRTCPGDWASASG